MIDWLQNEKLKFNTLLDIGNNNTYQTKNDRLINNTRISVIMQKGRTNKL